MDSMEEPWRPHPNKEENLQQGDIWRKDLQRGRDRGLYVGRGGQREQVEKDIPPRGQFMT